MLPIETINAVFPSSVRVGATSLGAMTILHAVALEAHGIAVAERNTNGPAKSCLAAWILSLDREELAACVGGELGHTDMDSWMRDNGIEPKEAETAVDRAFANAFANYVPPKEDENEIRFDDMPDGYGWPLELSDMIAHEHGRDIREVWGYPLATIFALIAVMRQRYGGESSGPDYYDRIRQAQFTEMARRERDQGSGNREQEEVK